MKFDIYDKSLLKSTIKPHNVVRIIHFTTQAGARYSPINPHEYISNNINCFVSILEVFHHKELNKHEPPIFTLIILVYRSKYHSPNQAK